MYCAISEVTSALLWAVIGCVPSSRCCGAGQVCGCRCVMMATAACCTGTVLILGSFKALNFGNLNFRQSVQQHNFD